MARKLTHDEYIEKCKENGVIKEFYVMSKYDGKRNKIKIRCKKCGAEREVFPYNFQKGITCTTCGVLKRRTKEEYAKEFYSVNSKNDLIGEFKSLYEKIGVKCKSCGHERKVKACNAIYKELDCIKCSQKKSLEEVKSQIEEYGEGEYELIDNNYLGDKVNINILHKKCGLKWNVRLSSLKRGHRCPACNRGSKGELEIIRILNNMGIDYRYEYSVSDLKGIGGKSLRYDFAIMNGENIFCFIEFDGRYHYDKSKERNPNRDTIKKHDELKNLYARGKGIKFVRIPYWKLEKMEQILKDELKVVM